MIKGNIYECKNCGIELYDNHNKLTNDMIKELKEQSYVINKKEKRTFWCNKHNCFHKYISKGKISQTYQKCLYSFDFYKFKEHMTNTEIFKLLFKKNWQKEVNKNEKSIK